MLAGLAERGIGLHRTDREGALRVVLGGRGPAAIAPRRDKCRYWNETSCNASTPHRE